MLQDDLYGGDSGVCRVFPPLQIMQTKGEKSPADRTILNCFIKEKEKNLKKKSVKKSLGMCFENIVFCKEKEYTFIMSWAQCKTRWRIFFYRGTFNDARRSHNSSKQQLSLSINKHTSSGNNTFMARKRAEKGKVCVISLIKSPEGITKLTLSSKTICSLQISVGRFYYSRMNSGSGREIHLFRNWSDRLAVT